MATEITSEEAMQATQECHDSQPKSKNSEEGSQVEEARRSLWNMPPHLQAAKGRIEGHESNYGIPPHAKGTQLGGSSCSGGGQEMLNFVLSEEMAMFGISIANIKTFMEGDEGDRGVANTGRPTVAPTLQTVIGPSHHTPAAYVPRPSSGSISIGEGILARPGLGSATLERGVTVGPTGNAVRGALLTGYHVRMSAEARERGGSQARVVHEAGGSSVYIPMDAVHTPQQSDHASAAAAAHNQMLRCWLAPVSDLIHRIGNTVTRVLLRRPSAVETVVGDPQAHVVDEADGSAVSIDIDVHVPQQSDQATVAAASTTNPTVGQQVLSAAFGGFVVLPWTNLHGTSKGDYPEYIKLGLFVGYLSLIGLVLLGIVTKKKTKLAMKVVAGMSIAVVTLAAVYQVSEKVYIKCIIGITGAISILVMGVVNWR